jgi:hypothetical protein
MLATFQKHLSNGRMNLTSGSTAAVFIFACWLALIFNSPLSAQINLSKYQPINEAAEDLYFERFQAAINTLRPFLDSAAVEELDQILAYQVLAFSLYSLQDGAASEVIRRALSLDIYADVDSNLFQKEYVKFFRYEKTRAVGKVQIRSNPPGASVFIGDTFIGVSPIDTLLLAGQYDFRLEQKDYRPKRRTESIQGGLVINNLVYDLAPKGKNLKWYAAGGALLAGGTIYFLTNTNNEATTEPVLPDLKDPPPVP